MILNSDSLFWYKGYVFQNCIYYVGFHCNHQVHFMPMCFTTWGLLEGLQYSFICRRKNPMFMLQRNNAALCWWPVDMRHLESAYWWTDEEVLDCYKREKNPENNKHCVKKVSANASSIILCVILTVLHNGSQIMSLTDVRNAVHLYPSLFFGLK